MVTERIQVQMKSDLLKVGVVSVLTFHCYMEFAAVHAASHRSDLWYVPPLPPNGLPHFFVCLPGSPFEEDLKKNKSQI